MKFMEAARTFPPGTRPKVRRKNWGSLDDRIELDDISALSGGSFAVGPWGTFIGYLCGTGPPDLDNGPQKIAIWELDDGSDEWEPWEEGSA